MPCASNSSRPHVRAKNPRSSANRSGVTSHTPRTLVASKRIRVSPESTRAGISGKTQRMVQRMAVFKTTLYLPDDLKHALERVARESGRSEADLIREGIRLAVAAETPPAPTIGILVSADPHFAENVDQHLAGFGER